MIRRDCRISSSAHQVAIVGVAVLSERNIKIHVGIRRIRSRLANVPGHARTAQRRTGQTDRNRFFAGDHADADRAAQPDAILRKHGFIFIKPLGKVVDEAPHVGVEIVVSIVGHAADAPGMTSQDARQTVARKSSESLRVRATPKAEP